MMSNKEKAVSFLKMAGFGDVRKAYDQYISPDFIHHNQYFKGDRESLMLAMEEAHKVSPNKFLEVKHIYEDGGTVITHSLVKKDKQDIAVVHIFRFQGDKVVELWDLGQLLDSNSPNKNGAF
jgi:predicted SnoaL-like aldol condensation-catalyzing enzyme